MSLPRQVIVIKGVVKVISLLLVMLFIPKLEDILSMVSSLMEVEMDMNMDGDMDKPKPPMKPDHHDSSQEDDEDANDEMAMEDAASQGDSGRTLTSARGGRHNIVLLSVLALANFLHHPTHKKRNNWDL